MTINERISDATIDEILSGVIEGVEPTTHEIAMAAEIKQYRAAEPVLYCMEGDTLDEENVSSSKAVVDAWVEEWNGEGRCPGEPQYRTVPLYRHAAPQVTSEEDEEFLPEIECDICGFKSTDPDGAHYCCEDNSDD
ncbi:hypothetical protein EGT71_01625 [Atlantibacter subterranea]|uniref:DUF551 domain-containing protein n=1 Tax=Atlantibacter subterraneus TaxID=255519 RepID=A0A3R9F5X2_9ENTR|nr:hypothetical protein [Atlantibacter subterranea]RSB64442.1 hypothetical protein EGK67_04425 [Atlantibacter subterranea]RSE07768.1 hypothetical protein EGT84_04360 [Atlantibacter subterranea]RSE29246.1 hypothetical protein EGT71_01625 [Atlantibacter subterranea]